VTKHFVQLMRISHYPSLGILYEMPFTSLLLWESKPVKHQKHNWSLPTLRARSSPPCYGVIRAVFYPAPASSSTRNTLAKWTNLWTTEAICCIMNLVLRVKWAKSCNSLELSAKDAEAVGYTAIISSKAVWYKLRTLCNLPIQNHL
jgi:hypothetical protein